MRRTRNWFSKLRTISLTPAVESSNRLAALAIMLEQRHEGVHFRKASSVHRGLALRKARIAL